MSKEKLCQKCGSKNSLIKNGKDTNQNQRYKCKSCKKTFILDESTTSQLQNSEYTFKKFIGYMIDDVTLEVIARNLDINIKTALYYRFLVFESLRNYQDEIILEGTVLIDETFVRINTKKYKLKRADGKGIRGISFNHLCVITMINLRGLCIAKVASRGMAKPQLYIDLCAANMGDLDLLIHDGSSTQKQFLRHFKCPNIDARRESDGQYTTILVDSLHSNIKRFLFKHAGYRVKFLQHYMNFFVYRYNCTPKTKYTNMRKLIENKNNMIEDLFNRTKKIKKTITYTTFQSDPGVTDILESVKNEIIN
jgi:DNA-directed RNA polymerase subunit RPC12/RpoP